MEVVVKALQSKGATQLHNNLILGNWRSIACVGAFPIGLGGFTIIINRRVESLWVGRCHGFVGYLGAYSNGWACVYVGLSMLVGD